MNGVGEKPNSGIARPPVRPFTSIAPTIRGPSRFRQFVLAGACGKLGAFANEVRAQTGKTIDAVEAAELVGQVSALRASLGCGGG